jgi:CspA family cold shock protein
MNGTIIRILADKGFGFIRGDDGKEYFFHRQDLQAGEFDTLVFDMEQGQTIPVVFESVPSPKGPRAGEVIRDLSGY